MLALLALLPLASPPLPVPQDPPPPPAAGEEAPLPQIQEEGDYYVLNFEEPSGDDQGVNLQTLTKICQQATGINFTYDAQIQTQLDTTTVLMFGIKRIPKEDFYNFFQILMFINNFVCAEVGPEHLRVVVIQPLTPVGGARPIKTQTIYVLPEELESYSDQVATHITTVLSLPNVDVRQLTNSLRSLLTDNVNQAAIPVGNTDSIILQGFASNVAALARLLQLVDEEMGRDTEVQPVFDMIPLEFAAAEDVADVVDQLLEAAKRVRQQTRTGAPAAGATAQLQTGGGEVEILVDNRTNSLIVMALPDDMQNIKELVARLDVDVIEPERTYRIYALDNVSAEEVADVLDEFITDASRITPTGGAATSPQGGQGRTASRSSSNSDVVVVPDPTTNSLLIAASKSRYEEILDLIVSLDKRQDQVLIETALIELTTTDLRDIGVELGFADIPGVSETGGFGLSSFGLSSFVDTDGDGIPDLRQPNITAQGLSAGILDGDDFSLPMLISAAAERRDTNVLNIPSVLVNNNGNAHVTSKDEQPTTQITATGGVGGTQENFKEYVEAGITLDISPSISASGYLRLTIFLEVSSFLGAVSGSIPPPKVTRTIQTTVNVPDGDTMVIGGIIKDNKGKTRAMIPWLGDLPILGPLFRRDTQDSNRTTLYFFVTPHILRDVDFADLAELSYQKKMESAEVIGADRIQYVDPDFGGGEDRIDFHGFDVPLYRSTPAGEVEAEEVGQGPVRRAEMTAEPGDSGAAHPPEGGEPPAEDPGPVGEPEPPAEEH